MRLVTLDDTLAAAAETNGTPALTAATLRRQRDL